MRLNNYRNLAGVGNESDSEELSKTRRKQQSTDLQHLGLELSRLSQRELDSLNLDDELRAALDQAQKIKPGGAFKRQIKFIGGFLRAMEDAGPIRENFARLKHPGRATARRHHVLEKWRDRLLAEGDSAVETLLEQRPAIDCQHLRQLVRNARKEVEHGKPPRSARMLYRYLGEFLD
ncbi:MAG: ribosome biogenesis factor YjgA [Methylococcales bacterium]